MLLGHKENGRYVGDDTLTNSFGDENKPGGDPTKIHPNVATYAWNTSRKSDLTDLAPINGTSVSLTLCWP